MPKSNPKSESKPRSKRALAKPPVSAALQYIPWHTVPLEDLNPLLQRQFVVGQEIMLARVLLKKGCIVPLHSHANEQLTYIVEGALKFYIDGRKLWCMPARCSRFLPTCRIRLRRWKTRWTWTCLRLRVRTGSTRPINTCGERTRSRSWHWSAVLSRG